MRRNAENLKPGQIIKLNRYFNDHPEMKIIYDFKQELVFLIKVKKEDSMGV